MTAIPSERGKRRSRKPSRSLSIRATSGIRPRERFSREERAGGVRPFFARLSPAAADVAATEVASAKSAAACPEGARPPEPRNVAAVTARCTAECRPIGAKAGVVSVAAAVAATYAQAAPAAKDASTHKLDARTKDSAKVRRRRNRGLRPTPTATARRAKSNRLQAHRRIRLGQSPCRPTRACIGIRRASKASHTRRCRPIAPPPELGPWQLPLPELAAPARAVRALAEVERVVTDWASAQQAVRPDSVVRPFVPGRTRTPKPK